MVRLRLLYRITGVVWALLGALVLLISLGYLLASTRLDTFFLRESPTVASVFGPLMRGILPSLQHIAGLLFGLYCVAFGMGLVDMHSWARTIGGACSFTMGVCLLALTYVYFVRVVNPDVVTTPVPDLVIYTTTLLGGIVGLWLVYFGYHLSTPSAMDAFFGTAPQMPTAPPAKCPTCGANLDLERARCPVCDREGPAQAPRAARLIDVQSGKEYMVSTRRETRIGRDNPGFDVQLEDLSVSGDHAWIECDDGHFILHVQGSALNPTYVNDMENRVTDIEIVDNDLVAFGQAQFRFKIEY